MVRRIRSSVALVASVAGSVSGRVRLAGGTLTAVKRGFVAVPAVGDGIHGVASQVKIGPGCIGGWFRRLVAAGNSRRGMRR